MGGYARPSDHELRRILKRAGDAGWRIVGGGRKHYRCFSPDKTTVVTVSCTPDRSGRAIANIKAQLGIKTLMATVAIALTLAASAVAASAATAHFPTYGNVASVTNPLPLGDCTIAAAADLVELKTGLVPSYAAVMPVYDELRGPNSVSSNDGVPVSSLFTYWQTQGFAGTYLASATAVPVLVGSTNLLAEINVRAEQGMTTGKAVGHGGHFWDWTVSGGNGPVASQHMLVIKEAYRWGIEVVTYGEVEYMTWDYWWTFGLTAWHVTLTR